MIVCQGIKINNLNICVSSQSWICEHVNLWLQILEGKLNGFVPCAGNIVSANRNNNWQGKTGIGTGHYIIHTHDGAWMTKYNTNTF